MPRMLSAFRLLLNALLNLSMEHEGNQTLICRNGLDILWKMLVDMSNGDGGFEEDEEVCRRILVT